MRVVEKYKDGSKFNEFRNPVHLVRETDYLIAVIFKNER